MNTNNLRIEIVLSETLNERWAAWFEGLSLAPLDSEATLLSGMVADQSALHGYLERIRDLNLKLISVKVEEQ
jgi:hypothetical protein